MAIGLKFNGTRIDDTIGKVKFNGNNVNEVRFNGTKVWPEPAPPPADIEWDFIPEDGGATLIGYDYIGSAVDYGQLLPNEEFTYPDGLTDSAGNQVGKCGMIRTFESGSGYEWPRIEIDFFAPFATMPFDGNDYHIDFLYNGNTLRIQKDSVYDSQWSYTSENGFELYNWIRSNVGNSIKIGINFIPT